MSKKAKKTRSVSAMEMSPSELIASGHPFIVWVPDDALVEGHGYRPSFVFEDIPGHVPNGTWPYSGKVGESVPWFWGFDLVKAQGIARAYNDRLGISLEREAEILKSSILASVPHGQG